MYRFIRQSVLVSAVSLAAASTAFAGSATSNLAMSANVTANCTISTAAVAFGAYDPIVANAATPLDTTGTVTITCTKGAPDDHRPRRRCERDPRRRNDPGDERYREPDA